MSSLLRSFVLAALFAYAGSIAKAHAQAASLDAGSPLESASDAGIHDPSLPLKREPLDASLAPTPPAVVTSRAAAESPWPATAQLPPVTEVLVRAPRRAGPGEFAPNGTGSKFNLPIEELPVTITSVDRSELRERAVQDVQGALSLMPGLTPMWTYGGFQSVSARGFQALMLIDGRRDVRSILSGSSPFTGLYDIERIEVLRGPSAVLYGYGAVGGTVNLIRRRASATPLHEVEFGLGTPRQLVAHIGSQGPIAPKLSYRVDLGRVSYENYRRYESERNQGTVTLRYAPTRRHTLQTRIAYNFDRYNTDVGIPTIEDPARPGHWLLPPGTRYQNRYSTKNDGMRYQRLDVALDYRFDISSALYLEARAGITHDRYSYLAAESLTYVPPMGAQVAQVTRGYLAFTHEYRPVNAQLELHADARTGPVQHKLAGGYTLDYVAGHTDRNGLGGAVPAPIDFVWPVDRAETVSLQRNAIDRRRHVMHSLYAFDHIKLLASLILTGGVRCDFLRSRTRREFVDVQSQDEIADPMTMMVRKPNRTRDFAPSGSVGLVANPWAPWTAYVSYGSGYKPQFVAASASSVERFDPELTRQFEGGMRARFDLAGHVLQGDLAGYLIRKKNVLVPRGLDERVPAGLVHSRGLDLSVRYDAAGWLQLDSGYSLIDAEYEKFVGPSAVTKMNIDMSGNTLRTTPRHSGNVWLRVVPAERVRLGIGTRVVGRQYADDEGRLRLPRYALLDASLGFGTEHVNFTLSGNNLLGRHDYFTSVIGSGRPQPLVTPGPGREILGVVRVEL